MRKALPHAISATTLVLLTFLVVVLVQLSGPPTTGKVQGRGYTGCQEPTRTVTLAGYYPTTVTLTRTVTRTKTVTRTVTRTRTKVVCRTVTVTEGGGTTVYTTTVTEKQDPSTVTVTEKQDPSTVTVTQTTTSASTSGPPT